MKRSGADDSASIQARVCLILFCAGMMMFCCPQTFFAQGQNQEQGPAVIRSRVFMVNLFVSAKTGKDYIRDLTRNDFVITENGVRQDIAFFNNLSQSRDLPLTVVMLVDSSASVSDKLQQEVATASAFFRQVLRPNKDMAALLQFHSEAVLLEDFTDSPDKMEKALKRIQPGGNTALYDAVYLASTEKLQGEAGRKVIVVLSDGEDTASRVKADEALKAAQKTDAIIYGLGVSARSMSSNFGILENFCRQTGGRFFRISTSVEVLRETFERIMEDLNHQYNLAYSPKNQVRNGAYRSIKIACARKGVKLSCREGYFPPEQ